MAEKIKQYRIIINNPELRKKDGTYECWVNGNFFKIKENTPTELPPEVVSHLTDHRNRATMPTGDEGSVDITQGFAVEIQKSFEVIEV